MQDEREVAPGVYEPITRGTPESARALEEARRQQQRDLAAARRAKANGASALEIEIIRNRSSQSPAETREEHRNDVLFSVRQVTLQVEGADGSTRRAPITAAMADRAIDATFRTSFDNDRAETSAIAVATQAFRNGNASMFDFLRTQEQLNANALEFSKERVAAYLQEQGITATPQDIEKIAIEGKHIATGQEARHGKSNGQTR